MQNPQCHEERKFEQMCRPDHLSFVAGDARTNLEKAHFEGGNDLLDRRTPPSRKKEL